MAKNTVATVVNTIAEVKPGATGIVGKHTIKNNGNLPVIVSEGARGAFRYTVGGVKITALMRWCGANGWKYDETRAVLALLGIGELVADDTVGCQLSSGRRSKDGIAKPHHGTAPDNSELGTGVATAMNTMRTALADAATVGRAKRLAEEIVTTGTGKKKVETPFNWRSGAGVAFAVAECGSLKVKAKPAKKSK